MNRFKRLSIVLLMLGNVAVAAPDDSHAHAAFPLRSCAVTVLLRIVGVITLKIQIPIFGELLTFLDGESRPMMVPKLFSYIEQYFEP